MFVQANLFVQKAGAKLSYISQLSWVFFGIASKVRLINMALITKVCRKRVWLLSGDSSSNIQMVTFSLSDSLKWKIRSCAMSHVSLLLSRNVFIRFWNILSSLTHVCEDFFRRFISYNLYIILLYIFYY